MNRLGQLSVEFAFGLGFMVFLMVSLHHVFQVIEVDQKIFSLSRLGQSLQRHTSLSDDQIQEFLMARMRQLSVRHVQVGPYRETAASRFYSLVKTDIGIFIQYRGIPLQLSRQLVDQNEGE